MLFSVRVYIELFLVIIVKCIVYERVIFLFSNYKLK